MTRPHGHKPAPLSCPAVRLPKDVVNAWETELRTVAKSDKPGDARLASFLAPLVPTIKDIWRVYNQDRVALGAQTLGRRKAAVAYMAGFHLANVARGLATLRRCAKAAATGLDDYEVLDLGCGTGAGAIACGAALGPPTQVSCIDRTAGLMQLAEAQLGSLYPQAVLTTKRLPLEAWLARSSSRYLTQRTDRPLVVSLMYVWNELARLPEARQGLLRFLSEAVRLRTKVRLLVVEPAQQAHARAAMTLRDALCGVGWHPLYPCPSAQPCPMTARQRDWCFSEFRWQLPSGQAWLDRRLGMEHRHLAASSYVFSNEAGSVGRPVVVGRPTARGSARPELLICDGSLTRSRSLAGETPARGLPAS